MTDLMKIPLKFGNNETKTLAELEGKAFLIVNVASKCGFTNQYEGLQTLWEKYKGQGLIILGFPCNQFGAQEPGSDEEIKDFCISHFSVSFPILPKTEVNGDNVHPIFAELKKQAKGILGTENIKWNFTKFLVNFDGSLVKRFAPKDEPKSLVQDIESFLS